MRRVRSSQNSYPPTSQENALIVGSLFFDSLTLSIGRQIKDTFFLISATQREFGWIQTSDQADKFFFLSLFSFFHSQRTAYHHLTTHLFSKKIFDQPRGAHHA
jgi:hypothetical protein